VRILLLSSLCLVLWVVSTAVAQDKKRPRAPFRPPPFAPKLPPRPEDLPDVPAILKRLASADKAERLAAVEQLQALSSEAQGAIGALTESIGDDSEDVRFAALHTLGMMRGDAAGALDGIRQRMAEGNSEFERLLATSAFVRISKDEDALAEALPTLAAALRSQDAWVAAEAANALSEAGTPATMSLTEALNDNSAQVRALAANGLGRIGARDSAGEIIQRLNDESPEVRAAAARALAQIGPAAKGGADQLVKMLGGDNSNSVRASAAAALGSIDVRTPRVLNGLARAGFGKDEATARMAVEALMKLKPDPNKTTGLMIRLLAEAKPAVATQAMQALADIGEPAVPALIQAIQDEHAQYWVVLVLSAIGPSAQAAVPALTRALDAASVDVRLEILLALAKIGAGSAPALTKIVPNLSDENEGIRYAATFAVASIGAKDAAAKAALERNYATGDEFLRMLSAWALARMNPRSPPHGLRAIRSLASALTSDDPRTQQAAAMALAELDLGPASIPQLLPKLGQAFESPDQVVRANAVEGLATILERLPPSPVLNTALGSPQLRELAIAVAQRLGPKAKGSVPALAKALTDSRSTIRRDTALTLAAIGPSAEAATESLIAVLADGDTEVRRAAAYALGSIGSGASAARQPLLEILASSDASVKPVAAWALVGIAPRDETVTKQATPQLIESLKADRAVERLAAAHALGSLGRPTVGALSALKYASQDPDSRVRKAAQESIRAITAGNSE